MKALLTITMALWALTARAQTFSWAQQLGGSMDDNSKVVAIDSYGNVFSCGRFTGIADFDPGVGTYNMTAGSSGAMFISKLNAAGDFVWAKQIDGNPDGLNLAVGMNGSVYITGNFKDVIDFDPDAGVYNLTTTSVGGSCAPHLDIFILKLNTDGMFMWAGQIGGTGDDYAGSVYHKAGGGIALGANDAIYVGGGIGRENNVNIPSSPLIDFDPGSGSSTNSSVTSPSFVVKLDSSGTFNWVSTWEGGEEASSGCSNTSGTTCHAVALDNSGNVYYTGKVGGWQAFVRKISSTGTLLWTATLSGGLSVSYDVAVDAGGNVYTTGYFAGTADFDPSVSTKKELKSIGSSGGPNPSPNTGLADAFVWKLSPTGTYQMAVQLGGAALSVGRSIALDTYGNIYTAGYFTGTSVDFNPHKTQKYLLNATGGEDVYISKLTNSGSFVWAAQLSGTQNERAYSLQVDGSGNVYTSGTFEGTVDFNPSNASANLTSFGNIDGFLHKINQTGFRMGQVAAAASLINIYPNPVRDVLNIVTNTSLEEIEIMDVRGRTVNRITVTEQSEGNIAIDVSSLEAGIYSVRVMHNGQVFTHKVVVIR